MWWNPAFILLIIGSTLIDYTAGYLIYTNKSKLYRLIFLSTSLCFNLGILVFFKYGTFFQDNLFILFRSIGYHPSWVNLNIILPVGISFYTFQTMSYTIDIYRKNLEPAKSILDFSLYVSFFPQLVAGPIVRAHDFLPSLDRTKQIKFDPQSILMILGGLIKKVAIADNLAYNVDIVYSDPSHYPSIIIILASLAFYVQIYCDFSGYTDIAIGIAKILGYNFPPNFNHPYFSKNPSEFWKRWHISLSSWLKDYLYIPLGGNRYTQFLTYRNLYITMILGGLWHGASWNFVLWGFLHGTLLVLHKIILKFKISIPYTRIMQLLSVLFFQGIIILSWIIFRQTNYSLMKQTLRKFLFFDFNFSLSGIGLGNLRIFSTIFLLVIFFTLHFISHKSKIPISQKLIFTRLNTIFLILAGIFLFLFWPTKNNPFIYFQF